MKKIFLLTVALATASVGFAQKAINVDKPAKVAEKVSQATKTASKGERIDASFSGKSLAPIHKSAATGLYYTRPEGSFYYAYNIEGYGYYYSALVVAPWKDFTYVNRSSNPTEVKWLLNFPVWNAEQNSYEEEYNTYDVTEDADEEGNYTTALAPGYNEVAPTITLGEDQFTLSETNSSWDRKGRETKVFIESDLYSLCGVDQHNGWYYGTGGLSTKYFWGTGTVQRNFGTDDAPDIKTGVCYAVRQSYDKPMSPLYIDNMFIRCTSTSQTPIAEGKALTLYVLNSETGEVMEELTATAADISGAATGGLGQSFQLVFSKKVSTPLGEMSAPVIIDYPFMVQIEGFDEEGVDVGLFGNEIADGDNMENAFFLVDYGKDADGKDLLYRHYYTDLALPLVFQALFDGVNVWETASSEGQDIEGVNVVKVSEDGQTCTNNALTSFSGAIVETATPWFDADDAEMYFKADDAPEWLTLNATYDESLDAYIVGVTCEALPAGETGRNAVVYIEGRGVKSETPILVVQGDASIPTGISTPVAEKTDANAPIYNLNGQRVSQNAKGILIQGGKKYIKK